MTNINTINMNGDIVSLLDGVNNGGTLKAPDLLWENNNPFTSIGAFNVDINLSSYYAILINHGMGTKYGTSSVIPVGKGGYLVSSKHYTADATSTVEYRYVNVSSTRVSFYNGHSWGTLNVPGACIPYKIFGISQEMYNILQPVNRV